MSQRVREVFRIPIPKPIQWGRWALHHDSPKQFRKVDQANEDHCGCCSTSFESNPSNPSNLSKTVDDAYLLPYCVIE